MKKSMANVQQDPTTSIVNEFGTRLTEIEERQRLLKDRLLLIGENLVNTKEEYHKEEIETRKTLTRVEADVKQIKQKVNRIAEEFESVAKKSELAILERQMEMFQPLELVRKKDFSKLMEKHA